MKKYIYFLIGFGMCSYLNGLNAQLIPSSLAEIRSFETKIDSMEQVIMASMKGVSIKQRTFSRYRSVLPVSWSRSGIAEEKMVLKGCLSLKKNRDQIVHDRIVYRNLKPEKKGDLQVSTRRINGELRYARVRDQATRTSWVYHSNGYLKVRRPKGTQVWYFEKPKP